jgi:hypothetical protein
MSDKFTDALLKALNESTEVNESDWNSIAAVLRGPAVAAAPSQETICAPAPENRYAATVSSCMAKIREGR